MKLKCAPDDFQVEEQLAPLSEGGPLALYELTKTSLGTLEAIDAITDKWHLRRGQLAFAGLKDRHAVTRQFVTIQGGPRRGLKQTSLELKYVQQVARHVHAKDIVANRFVIVLRDLATEEVRQVTQSLELIARDGLPNYFDSQRFGSLGKSGQFIARPWCLGDYERALWLAVAEENMRDRPEDREAKRILRQKWGKWPECRPAPAGTFAGRIAAFLTERPGDFKRALTLIPQNLRSIYLAAYQSDLWNRWLSALVKTVVPAERLTGASIGSRVLPLFKSLTDDERFELHATLLPLPSARLRLEDGPLKQLLESVLAEEGIELREMRLKFPRDTFFSKGERKAVILPQHVSCEAADDDLYRDRQKLTLRFALPRGSYATLLVKRLGGNLGGDDHESEENV